MTLNLLASGHWTNFKSPVPCNENLILMNKPGYDKNLKHFVSYILMHLKSSQVGEMEQ